MESAFQGKVLADILVDSYFCIEIGRGIGWSGGMAVSTPDEIGGETPAVWQSELRSQLEDGKIDSWYLLMMSLPLVFLPAPRSN